MANTKSMAQIAAQGNRLIDMLSSNISRMEKVREIYFRYDGNICKHFGQKDYMSNEQFNTQIDRAIYMGTNN